MMGSGGNGGGSQAGAGVQPSALALLMQSRVVGLSTPSAHNTSTDTVHPSQVRCNSVCMHAPVYVQGRGCLCMFDLPDSVRRLRCLRHSCI